MPGEYFYLMRADLKLCLKFFLLLVKAGPGLAGSVRIALKTKVQGV